MRYEEKAAIAEEAIKNRNKLKTSRTAPYIFVINQIIIIAILLTALLIGTDDYAVYLIIPVVILFTFVFYKNKKISVICSSVAITACLPIFIVSSKATCIRNQSKPYDNVVTKLIEGMWDEKETLREEKKAQRDLGYEKDCTIANLMYLFANADSIIIGFFVCKMLNEHEKLKMLEGYPLFEVSFDEEINEKVNRITEERIRRREQNNEYLR